MPDLLDRVVSALEEHQDWSQIRRWRCSLEADPMWHRKDRFTVEGTRKGVHPNANACFFEAHFRIRNDGVGLVFRHNDHVEHWSELVMPEWQEHSAVSAMLACALLSAVPPGLQRSVVVPKPPSLRDGEAPPPGELSYIESKGLQERLRKLLARRVAMQSFDSLISSLPGWFEHGLELLGARHDSLDGADVKEQLQKLVYPFRFLISRGVPFEQVRLAWNAASVEDVMES